MPKSKWRPLKCKECGVPRSDGVYLSKRGYCEACTIRRISAAAAEMARKEGPAWDRYREVMSTQVEPRRRQGVGGRFEYDEV